MSISKIQLNRKIKEFSELLVKKGIEPNNYEINILLKEYFDNHTLGMPYYSPIKQKPYEESSKDDYNHNFLTFKEDIETAYEANIEANNKAVSIQEYYDTEKTKVFHAIDKISLRINCLEESMKSNKRIQEYVEVFDSLYNLELYGNSERNIPYTTSFIDLLQKKVTNEKTNNQVNKLSIVNSLITLTGIDNFQEYETNGSLEKILNDTINDVFIFTGKSKNNTEMSLNVIIDLKQIMKFNTVFFKSTSSNQMIFTLALSDDGNNFYTVYDIKGKDLVEWNFETKSARYIKITSTKIEADGNSTDVNGLNIYEYYYIFKNITVALEKFESKSIMVTKPIEFDNLTNFIKLDAEDMTFNNTKINYFIGFDNGYDKVGWDAIPNHKEHQLFMFEKIYRIANPGTYENYGVQSAVTGLYQIYKLPNGVNTNSLKVTPGYNMWFVERYYRKDGDSGEDFVNIYDTDFTDIIRTCDKQTSFVDCENYSKFQMHYNNLYIFTQYVDINETTSIYNKYINVLSKYAVRKEIIEDEEKDVFYTVEEIESMETENGTQEMLRISETNIGCLRLFVNGYEQIVNDKGTYSINLKKGVNKIQIAIYVGATDNIDDVVYLNHNLNFKDITNNVFAFKPMKYTNINVLKKSLEQTYSYYAIKNNIIYTNIDPNELIKSANNDMGFFISYYGLKDGMQKFFKSNKLRFRIMAILNSKTKNISPSILNFRITGK